jgi:MFS transporter, putative metabolite:H+ symporter
MPESPRWLASQGKLHEADETLKAIETEVTRNQTVKLPPLLGRMPALVKERATLASLFQGQYLGRTLLIWALMLCTSIVGYSLLTWMPTIYRTVLKLPVEQTLQYGLVGSIASFLGVISGAFLVDAIGRRPTFAMGFFGSAIALGILWSIALNAPAIYVVGLAAVGLYFISILLSGLYLYVPELYPTRMRALGAGTGSAWLRVGSIIGPTLVGWLLSVSDLSTVFLVFAVIGVIGGLLIIGFATETRGRILEELAP